MKYSFLFFILILLSYYFVNLFLINPSSQNIKNEELSKSINLNQDIERTATIIAKSSVIYLSNFAIEGLEDKIELDLQNSSFIEAIEIKDNYLNENLITAYKDKNKQVVFKKQLPKKYKLYNTIKKDIVQIKDYTKNSLGELTIYFKDASYYKKLVNLSKEEKDFLDKKPILNLCVAPNWAPFEKIEDGKHIGITSDILKIITEYLNIKTNLIITKTWKESLEKIKNKQCDFVPIASKTASRQQFMNFTKPYISTNIVVATKANVPFFDNLYSLESKTFAVLEGLYLYEKLKKQYKNINFIEVSSIKEGLSKVETKEVFGYIDNSLVINHSIEKSFIGLIAVSGKLSGEMKLSMATRKDYDLLNSIFNKALILIDKQTKLNVYNKWIKTNYQIKTDYTLVWQIVIVFLIIFLTTLYWNRKLRILNKQLQKQRNKAYEASKAKAKFLANMSHEIRTPMNSIIGMSHLILETNLKKQQKEYIEKIDKSANSLLRIINDILDFSKIEAGKIEFHNAAFKLKDVVNECIDYIDLELDEKNLEFILKYDENLSEYYFGDKLRVSQVLTNILHNAVKFTNKGFIKLEIVQKPNNIIFIEVEDSGIGLNKTEQKKIFESFSQGDLSTSKEYKGTGLGLAISKDLVQLMNGKIYLESKKDVGTKFFIELQLKSTTKDLQKDISKQKPDFSNKTILLVEDNLVNQQIIEGILNKTNVDLKIVSNGKDAIKLLEAKKHFDLILMDIQMPIIDGYETSKIIRKTNKSVPILALSANSYEEDIKKSIASGMNNHLKKPIQINSFFSTIKKYI